MPDYRRFALILSYVTVGYNILEGLLSVAFAKIAGSSALLGFGIDSFVESLSGMIMIWRFWRTNDPSFAQDERREQAAIRLIGVSMVVLGGYVAYESITTLYYRDPPDRSLAGILIAALSLLVMPTLYILKRRTAAAIDSRSLTADAKQTLACILLSVALLIGTGLHYSTGLWQADPIAGLIIAAFLVREGYEAWSRRELCCG
jgi:divalent metal cation (Fe/Co/Zn/Cd) transporter